MGGAVRGLRRRTATMGRSVRHESLWFVLVTSIKEVIVSHSEQSPSGARPDLFKMSEGGNAEDVTEKPKFTLGWTVK